MRLAWVMARKEALQTIRDRTAFIFTLILPLAFMVFLGYIFGAFADSNTLPLAVVDQDRGAAASEMVDLLEESPLLEVEAMAGPDADEAVDSLEVAAALIIPNGFSRSVGQEGKASLTFVQTPGSTAARSVQEVVSAAAGRLVNARLAARAATEATSGPDYESALTLTKQLLAEPRIQVERVESGTETGQIASGFEQSAPGTVVNWVLFGLLGVAIGLVLERRSGVFDRLRTTRLTMPQLVGGKILGMMALTLAQQVILIAVGQFVLGVDFLRSPVALVATVICLSLFASAVGLLLASLFKSEQAVIASTVIISMALSAMGGAWFPLEITGAGFSRVAHFLPTAWVVDAFHGIILKGWGIGDVVVPCLVVLGWTAACFAGAVFRLRVRD